MTIALIVAGALMIWGYSFANGNVGSQLTAQQITFPPKGSPAISSPQIAPYLSKYAGQQLTTGEQAKAYADHFIAVHLREIGGGKTYAQVSAEAQANPSDAALSAKAQTLFRGETLRGLLLTSYAFWKMGQLALIGAIVSFALAAVLAILTLLGFIHAARVSGEEEAFTEARRMRSA